MQHGKCSSRNVPPSIMNAPTRLAKLAFAFTLALVSAAQPAVAAVIAFDAIRHGERIDIHARAALNADVRTAWRVLTDYNRYPEYMPDLQYAGYVTPRFSLFGHFEKVVVERNAAREFQALADEIERQFAARLQ